MANNLQNSGDQDQMPHYVASDLGVHFLPTPLCWVPEKKWVKTRVVNGHDDSKVLVTAHHKSK